MGEIILEASLFGPRLLNGRYAANTLNGVDMRLQAAYLDAATAIMEAYKDEIAARFALTHGQSGDTEKSMEVTTPTVELDAFKIGVRIGGHVGFVINKLPGHFEPRTFVGDKYLGDFTPTGAASGRGMNFFSPFGPRDQVFWEQGGDESFSPDTTWYTGKEAWLTAQTHMQLAKLSQFVALNFGYYGDETLWSRNTIARIQGPYYKDIYYSGGESYNG